jgi:hypothetical protein
MRYMQLLEIDKYEYKLNENLLVTINPGTYIDSCFGLRIQNLDKGEYITVEEFDVCQDVITTIKDSQKFKIFLNEKRYTSGKYEISVIAANGKGPQGIRFIIL